MRLPIAARIALRELRGGIRGFRVFLACLALGVAAIAAVGTVRESIEAGLRREGAALLGGDAAIELTYRFATPEERAFLESRAEAVSEIVDFRSMAVAGEGARARRALTQVKAVDDAYPLIGTVRLDPPMPLAEALSGDGAVMDTVLIARLGLAPGDSFRLGAKAFTLRAALLREPDAAAGGFGLGPRTIVRTAALEGAGLLAPGSLFETEYRLRLAPGTDLAALRAEAEQLFEGGMRWRDARNGAPGIARFVDRLGAFLVLVGLAGLAVGGVGVSSAVRAYLEAKTPVIATLKALGATSRVIFTAYALQIGTLTALGIAIGLALGLGAPLALAPIIEARLPVPAAFAPYPRPALEAALYGALAAALFTLWPLAQSERVRPAALWREAAGHRPGPPAPRHVLATLALLAALIGAAAAFSGLVRLTLWSALGLAGAFALLVGVGWGLKRLARRLARGVRRLTVARLALGSVGGPGSEAGAVVLSLGLGLSVLAAIGQIDANLRGAIARDLPKVAPAFFAVDIQKDQLEPFRSMALADPAVSRVETAPMLRGIITRINGRPAREVAGDHWVLRGDRGVTYSARPREGTVLTEGAWWPEDYAGPPLLSFAAEEAAELGLRLGDRLTVNILGREIEAEIVNFREVDFSNAGIGFVMAMNPGALAAAPHTSIATIYAAPEAEARLMAALGDAFPNVTLIRVRDAIERVTSVLAGIAAAVTWGALATLVTGLVVLIGAAAAGERARAYEAAVLKTLGATRATVLANFALRSAIFGLAAGVVAIVAGGLAGWAVMHFVMEVRFRFEPVSAIAIVAGGAALTTLAGLAFAWRPLSVRPARVLRSAE
ncbi:putative ABC transport system permease protein [Meinhardsimonia xiamenensis]|jgi:putative ABC transport system permease protein|uniref:Putative ABC transport system permease protein n=1 Tax=Meinhardsimonia xiamenensis TaxID=990712 RepID=A0A1G8YRH9_9RHOB|nr:FtsX-like permease family protein [Meinhardsimonia xiamenensis]PRX37409.1 putative ABC transport system permease protein [Meinhardsimonia xiamenensis]SDK05347.1 putative ABC transport system permease protein [Meinhardsimonia xiamenensis]